MSFLILAKSEDIRSSGPSSPEGEETIEESIPPGESTEDSGIFFGGGFFNPTEDPGLFEAFLDLDLSILGPCCTSEPRMKLLVMFPNTGRT
jgi:hypothetical protein